MSITETVIGADVDKLPNKPVWDKPIMSLQDDPLWHSPRIKCRRDGDGTWSAVLYIEGKWWAIITGFGSQSEARRTMKDRYL